MSSLFTAGEVDLARKALAETSDRPLRRCLALLRDAMPQAEAHVVRFPDAHGRPKATNTVYIARCEQP